MSIVFLTLGLALAVPQASDQDWPQFMGPNETGAIEGMPTSFEWGEAGPKIMWKTDLGGGYGGVAVKGGEVILLDREVGELDIMRVMDLRSGDELWDYGYEAAGRLQYPGSRSVPSVTDEFIVTMGGHGDLACYSRKNKDLAWRVNVAEIYEGLLPDFGWSNSPLIVGDLVIVSVLGEEVGLAAFELKTGEEVWVTPGVGISHSSPVVLNLLGRDQLLFLSSLPENQNLSAAGKLTISSYEPRTGDLIWQENVLGTTYPIPRPIKIDDERIFVSGGYEGGSSMLKLSKSGPTYKLEELFHMQAGSQLHSPILFEGHLYFIVNENSNHQRNLQKTGGMLCMTLEGKEVWRTGADPFFGRGNWVIAAGHLFIQDGFNGKLTICKASPAGYEPVAEANLFGIDDRKDHEMWSPMAIVDGLLLLRSKEELICVNLLQPAE